MIAVEIRNLSKTYANGTVALKDVSLTIQQGDFFALLGANGAGKTTLIGILTSLVRKNSGVVKVFGLDIERDFTRVKRLIGVVPQELNFNIFEKVQDILITQAGYFGIAAPEAGQRSEAVLRQLGLWEQRQTVSRDLSGGMKRRLMIARALIHHPKLLILDEPTAGVDVELRYGMWDYLRQLNRDGVTILLTTHYLEEVEQMCRNAAIIKKGAVIQCDAVANLIALMDEETYHLKVKDIRHIDQLQEFHPVVVSRDTFKVTLLKDQLHLFMTRLQQTGMLLTEIHPQGHRLERLFLKLVKE